MNLYFLLPQLSQVFTPYFLLEALKILLISLISYITYFYFKYFTRENPLPGPFPLPFIGNVHLFVKSSQDVKEIDAKYGDLCEYYMGPSRCILVRNEELIQKILRPTIKGPFHNRVPDSDGLEEIGVLNVSLANNSNYDDWSYHRRFFNKVLMSPQFMRQSVKVVLDSFVEMSGYWDNLGEDKVLEFHHWMRQYFYNVIFATTTSKPAYATANYYNKINPNNELNLPDSVFKECDLFIESVNAFIRSNIYFSILPRIIRNFPGFNSYTKNLKERIAWLRNYIDEIIKLKQDEISKTPIDQKLTPDILTMFLTVNTERDITERITDDLHIEPMSAKNIQANFITILAGAIDNSSNTICFIVDFLENNPQVKQKMIEEIERVLGKDPDSPFTYEDLSKLEYVEAVITETLRIKPISTRLSRVNSVSEDVGGYKWSENTTFILDTVGIHFHKSYWKEPETFNPDRYFESPESKQHLYIFGGGLRKCPGRNLAMAELKASLVALYRKYNIELMGPLKENASIVRNCEELKVRVKKR